MNNKVERQCPVCGVTYHAKSTRLKHGRQTTCSRTCSYKLRAVANQNGKQYTCPVCGQRFYRTPCHVKAHHGNTCCSSECAYKVRQRTVTKPYVMVAIVDRSRAMKKAWETRRIEAKPYPDSARQKAAAQAVRRIQKGGGVSKFEKKAAEMFRLLGFQVEGSLAVRNDNGTYRAVFDLYLPARGMVVECHGTYWHGGRWSRDTPTVAQAKNLRYEERKVILARELGLDLRLLWEHHFQEDPCGACLGVIR